MAMEQVELEVRLSPGAPSIDLERLRQLVRSTLNREDARGELGLWVCTDDEIAELHQRFMGISGPTDVMSFPGDLAYLGDIAVSFETAVQQAIDAGHPTGREIAYLTLHGLLHLLGYDDRDPADRERMIARQDQLIAAFEREVPGDWD